MLYVALSSDSVHSCCCRLASHTQYFISAESGFPRCRSHSHLNASTSTRCTSVTTFPASVLILIGSILQLPQSVFDIPVDANSLRALLEMGFPEVRARKALLMNRYVQSVLCILCKGRLLSLATVAACKSL